MSIKVENLELLEQLLYPPKELSPEKPQKIEKPCKTGSFWISRNFNLARRKPVQWLIKRTFDIVFSIMILILTSPLLLIIAIAIKLESEGPVIYKSRRTGLYGHEFYLYKFRSMAQDAEQNEDQVRKMNNEESSVMYKIDNDPRLTAIGGFLRKYSLDELPQLINIIKGDMSIVGPRPRASRDLKFYKNWHYLFFGTLPGLTGMWQANGRSLIKDFDTVVKMEYNYLCNWNLLLDFYLILKTIPVVIFGKNTA